MANINGLTSKELIRFSDMLIKANHVQLELMNREIWTEKNKRIMRQYDSTADEIIDAELDEKIYGGNGN